MRRRGTFYVCLLFIAAVCSAGCTAAEEESATVGTKLEIGNMAPLFSLPGSDGKTYDLEQIIGRQAVVIAWFPKAFTGG